MSQHTFKLWLESEITSARCALLVLYEEQDKLLYIEGPRLEREYMEKVGAFEETVIKEEIECEILQKKQQMIQTAINRREPVDEAAIDAQLDEYRRQMHEEAAGPAAPQEYAELNDEQRDTLQELYRIIVKNYHPQMHPELTEAQKQLFQKAQEAYRRRDLPALQLIYDMLVSTPENEEAVRQLMELLAGNLKIEDGQEEEKSPYSTDYSLASIIYRCFQPSPEEAAIQEELQRYQVQTDYIMADMDRLGTQFPFSAADMLSDPTKVEEYLEGLSHRLRTAQEEQARRKEEIRMMLEGVTARG